MLRLTAYNVNAEVHSGVHTVPKFVLSEFIYFTEVRIILLPIQSNCCKPHHSADRLLRCKARHADFRISLRVHHTKKCKIKVLDLNNYFTYTLSFRERFVKVKI
jgi:hypothetical protein